MRFLGIDYGTKRIGLAFSDENHTFAFPKEIIPNNKDVFEKLGKILEQENISEVVIGESLDFSGQPNVVANQIDDFVSELENKFKIKVSREKEFLTSVEARKAGNTKMSFQTTQAHSRIGNARSEKVDASAAALILQRFLDRYNHNI